MIVVEIFTSMDGEILGFRAQGHSEFGCRGNDIVCAAVSSVAFMVANTITDVLGVGADISVDDAGLMVLKISKSDSYRCREILSGFKIHMLGLEEQYPKNINVNYTEV